MAAGRDAWRRKNRYYYDAIESLFRDLIPRQRSVIEIGCGTGELLAALQPQRGLGIDFSKNMIDLARARFSPESNPQLEFCVGDAENLELDEPFDYVVMSDVIGEFNDVWTAFRQLQHVTRPNSRVVISYFNGL